MNISAPEHPHRVPYPFGSTFKNKTMKNIRRTVLIGALIMQAPASFGAVSFNFSFLDPSDPNWTPEAKGALTDAGNRLTSYFSNYNATIDLLVSSTTEPGAIASASSYHSGTTEGFGNIGVVGTKILSNGANDLNGALSDDGVVEVNFSNNFSYTNSVGVSQFDFTSLMMHELAHSLGFTGALDTFGESRLGTPKHLTPWDQYVVNGYGAQMIDPATYLPVASWDTDSVGGTGTVPASASSGLYFGGPNALAANGGNYIPLYSPETYAEGSSAIHLDDFYYSGSNVKLMNATSDHGPRTRELSAIEIAMFKDLGYTNIVPEPSSAALLGLGGLTLLLRRRNV